MTIDLCEFTATTQSSAILTQSFTAIRFMNFLFGPWTAGINGRHIALRRMSTTYGCRRTSRGFPQPSVSCHLTWTLPSRRFPKPDFLRSSKAIIYHNRTSVRERNSMDSPLSPTYNKALQILHLQGQVQQRDRGGSMANRSMSSEAFIMPMLMRNNLYGLLHMICVRVATQHILSSSVSTSLGLHLVYH